MVAAKCTLALSSYPTWFQIEYTVNFSLYSHSLSIHSNIINISFDALILMYIYEINKFKHGQNHL
jgi:hypothetical protein